MMKKLIGFIYIIFSVLLISSFNFNTNEIGNKIPNTHLLKTHAGWEIDMDHSSIGFVARHLGIAKIHGYFKTFKGSISGSGDDIMDAIIQFTIDVNSLDSFNGPRDTHLKSTDFFNVKDYPEIIFRSSSIKRAKGGTYKLSGDLTIKDVTKKVTFDLEKSGEVVVMGVKKTAFEATTVINRFDYKLNWNALTPEGKPIVDSEVTLLLNMEIYKGV